MANYTIELRHVVEEHNIFDFDYPFYDERKRPDFEKAFIRHFYFREICCDTVDRFKLFLEDKMKTVFPYYNELFNTANVEYSILDNYNIRETTSTKRENVGSTSGESYAVGKTIDEQSAETTEDRTAHKSGDETATSENTRNASATSETVTNGTEAIDSKEDMSVTEDKTKALNETETTDNEEIKKFLDTPQGQVDLSDSKYLTTLSHDTQDKSVTKKHDGTENNEQVTAKTVDTDKVTSENTTTTGTETTDDNGTVKTVSEGDETSNTKTGSTFTGEQRSTNDTAIRSRSEGEYSETIEHTRRGNIGVDTDADMIQKHIRLQKILKEIEKMFFNECEDLFMLVW